MYPTVEVRWFERGTIPSQTMAWFKKLPGPCVEQPTRVDYYFLNPDPVTIGLKLRDGKIELKYCTQKFGEIEFQSGIVGFVEAWTKWSFVPEEQHDSFTLDLISQPNWFAVEKRRRLRKYHIVAGKTVVPAPADTFLEGGCDFELTGLLLDGQDWWSLGFEAHGENEPLFRDLTCSAKQLLQDWQGNTLRSKNSYSYPKWLQRVR